VFFALFNVLRAVAEGEIKYGLTPRVVHSARNAHILWATIADRIVTSPLPPYHLAPGVPVSAMIEIGIVVLISATTTFMTVRQSVKRGIGQPGQDPNNPMANSQKYMMYIAPLFALSGLYWQFGLVMYWVTTNLWTLGQQYVLFRNMAPITTAADADSATAPAAKGTAGPAGTTVSKGATTRSTSARGTASKPAAKGTAAKTGTSGTSGTGSAKAAAAATTAKSGTKVSNGQPGNGASSSGQRSSGQRSSGQRGSSQGGTSQTGRAQRTTTAARPQTAKSTSSKPAETSNGGERRGLGRLVRNSKPEPEPEPEVPATKLVRQQPVRQSRSKRSGKR
jgi:hypothetical protein